MYIHNKPHIGCSRVIRFVQKTYHHVYEANLVSGILLKIKGTWLIKSFGIFCRANHV